MAVSVAFVLSLDGMSGVASPPGIKPTVRGGSGIPAGLDLPVGEPIYARPVREVIATEGGGALPLSYGGDPYKAIGTIAAGVCQFDFQCDDCNPCTIDTCDLPAGSAFGTCSNLPADTCTSCDDGVFCNGRNLCNTHGQCIVANEDPCASQPGWLCNETGGPTGNLSCDPICTIDAECLDDGLYCNGTEFCDLMECVGGVTPPSGAPCTSDADCDTANGAYCGGVCRSSGSPCGERTYCDESNDTCGWGRCCVETVGAPGYYGCEKRNKADCEADGGVWLGLNNPSIPCDSDECCPAITQEATHCPSYASGIAMGEHLVAGGPVGRAGCNAAQELGDDYSLSNADASPYFHVQTLRLVWGWETVGIQGDPSRIRITFYDAAGNLVADTVTDSSSASGEPALRTVIFTVTDPPVIPSTGFVSMQTSARYSPYGQHYWMSTTAADVGANDPDVLWVNGAATDASLLGGRPGVLAFELVGEKAPAPLGACCDNDTGECTRELPWTCEAAGSLFQGVGTYCRWCSTPFPIRACSTDADCQFCIGGTSPGELCTVDADCGEGGSCSGTDTCVPVPPACQLSACCNPADGACETVSGGLCEDDTTPCISDADCATIGNGTCNPRCDLVYGPGWISQSFGTSCEPNCCEQPTQSGGDSCDTATVHSISVPPVGEPPVTITITGDNSNASFGDYAGDGGGTCDVNIHDPDSIWQDRGWWEAFHVDACAYVRLDYCCTDSLSGNWAQPAWSFIRQGCDPCGLTTETSALPGPIGNVGSPYVGYGSGEPFCNGDEPWQTYGPLPAGTYYHNVYSAPNGAFGPYQMHITAMACLERACCLPESQCVDSVTKNILFDGAGDPIPCSGDADCPADGICRTCASANKLDCKEADGFWNGEGNLPYPTDAIISCEESPCERGSCCTIAGDCSDSADAGTACDPDQPLTCMSRSQCDSLGGTFRGGERCDFPNGPCPTCTVRGASNCQYPPHYYEDPSDLAMPPTGVVSADDFIPEGDTVETVCVWGMYTDEKNADQDPAFDCVGDYGPDVFRVRIYADGGGLPGNLIGERLVTGADVTRHEDLDNGISFRPALHSHNLVLDPPITGIVPFHRHWLEVANGADRVSPDDRASGNTCVWNWSQYEAPDGRDEFGARGTDDRSIGGNPPQPGSGYIVGGGHHADRAFCLGMTRSDPLAFDPGPEQPGACFDCATQACTVQTQIDCIADAGVWRQDNPYCAQPFQYQLGGICGLGSGATSGSACVGGVPDGFLDPGEECDDGQDIDPGDGCHGCLLYCEEPVVTPGGAIFIGQDGQYAFDTTCAPTDGPPYVGGLLTGPFGKDIWFEYHTSVTGRMFASLCPTGNAAGRDNGYDAWIALYHDALWPGYCPCPGPNGVSIDDSDEGCKGLADGGPGYVSRIVLPGECYLIRVGGWQSAFGQGLLDVATIPGQCELANPPVPETIADWGGVQVVSAKNRFLSFSNPDNPGRTQGIRVTFVSLPPPYDTWNGAQFWVGTPIEVSENGSAFSPIPDFPNFWAAPLVCDLASARFADWDADYGTVHVFHEGIVPGGVYEIQAIDETCAAAGLPNYSAPTTVTNPRWGDAVGKFDAGLGFWTAPDGFVNVSSDVVAALDKFSSAATAPTKARVDVEPRLVDLKINITDVTMILDAFAGAGYPFSPPGPPPCD